MKRSLGALLGVAVAAVFAGCSLYSPSSFWNTPIGVAPAIDPNSAAMVQAALVGDEASANIANTDAWGIAAAVGSDSDKSYTIGCTAYDCGTTVTARIPAGVQPSTGSDHHLVIFNGTTEIDMWEAQYDSTHDTWSAGSRYTLDATGWGAVCAQGQHCNGADAAGVALMGGVVQPDDFARSVIPHALALTVPDTRSGYIACPATHTDGASSSSDALPEGAHVQLDPSFNVDAQSWPDWEKTIARTLQQYGAYVVDTGGSVAIRGLADVNQDSAWEGAGVPEGATLSKLPWGQMRVLRMTQC